MASSPAATRSTNITPWADAGFGIPVEQDGGAGTAGSHWDEETFGNELMTGYINEGENYFTAMSAASFEDIGYVITAGLRILADTGYIFA